ncbi:MAG: alkaline phosphatase family protein, partial [Myxococcales bacterium]|nr:alkaline phosphatase family protein [Myxococcales bacterium]
MTDAPPLRPSLVLALDGATFSVIEPMVARGELPHLARALREGRAAPLPSVIPPVTFPAWSSFATGLEPGDHGVFDFTQKVPGAYRLRFANASDRAGTSLFRRVCDAGGRVLVLGMPAAFPPEPLDGLLVCGFDAPVSTGTDERSASDPALYRRIASAVGPWMRPDIDESARDAGFHERAVETLLARVERKERFALEALRVVAEQGPPALAMVVWSESDTVGHHYWRDHDAHSPRHDPRASAARKGAIEAVYARLDAACGALRAAFEQLHEGRDPACFVLSDHGMGGAARFVVHVNARLAEAGLLARARHAGAG